VDLSYTDEQELFRASVREFVSDRLPPDRLAEIADGEDGWDQGLWKEALGLGLGAISIPEERGGTGLGFVEEAIAAEELGRGVFPGPWLGSVVLAQPALVGAPDLLEAVGRGERIATVVGLDGPVREGSTVPYVVDLAPADLLVIHGQDGLVAMDRDATEWRVLPTADGTRRLGEVTVRSLDGPRLWGPEDAQEVVGRVRTRALAALAAEAVGVASRVTELAAAYAREREQFGGPVGRFQAVSHQVADSFTDTEKARSLAMWAAAALEDGDPGAPQAAATAKWFAADAAVRACERAIQVHGGIGFTWEAPLHRFYKRAQWIRVFPSGSSDLRAWVADGLLR
jgi:alkylation response protein AidB-like acyl-CoA dehydrogenase